MHALRLAAAMQLAAVSQVFSQNPPSQADQPPQPSNEQRPALTGKVVDLKKNPLAGATVAIYTAAPKVGTSTYCPSCYPDCAKTATTDNAGAFTIRSLDPSLVFRVLVIADGHSPAFVAKVDPAKGPIETVLKPTDPARLKPGHVLHGRVLDPEGSPVFGASVIAFGKKLENGATYGVLQGVDPLAVTNKYGEFALTAAEPDLELAVQVDARGYLRLTTPFLAVSDKIHDLHVRYGVTVRGRVVKDGKPLTGVGVGIDQVNRRPTTYLGHHDIATGKDGRFEIQNVVPDEDHHIYGLMDSLRSVGTIPARQFRAGADRSNMDIGDLEVKPGFKLAGRVILADGKPIPPHTRFALSRRAAWDTQTAELREDGAFLFDGLPPEEYSVHVVLKGYRFSRKNESLDKLNFNGLMGRVDVHITDLRVLLEPGEQESHDPKKRRTREEFEALQRIHQLPIRGVPKEP